MPKKLLKRYIPDPATIKTHTKFKFLGPLLQDPNLFHLNRDSVSMAFLVGIFLAFFPFPGQTLLAVLVALWIRCNLPIAVALVWLTNPITAPPVLYLTYKLGAWLLGTPPMVFAEPLTWQWLNTELARLWQPLLLGLLVAGSLLSLTSYFSIRFIWRQYVLYQWNYRQKKRHQRKAGSRTE